MGVLDGFDAGETGDEYAGLLAAKNVREGQPAVVAGFTTVRTEDGKDKPAVILRGKWSDRQGEVKMALILKRSNGAFLAREARAMGGESGLIGFKVALYLDEVDFRGRTVQSITLRHYAGPREVE